MSDECIEKPFLVVVSCLGCNVTFFDKHFDTEYCNCETNTRLQMCFKCRLNFCCLVCKREICMNCNMRCIDCKKIDEQK